MDDKLKSGSSGVASSKRDKQLLKRKLQQETQDENDEEVEENPCDYILYVPYNTAVLPPRLFNLIKVRIESEEFDELNSQGKLPFINYMYTNDVRKCRYELIVEKKFKRLVHFSPSVQLDYLYCFFNHEGQEYALCKSSGLQLLGVMFTDEVKKTAAYKNYLSNKNAFRHMLHNFGRMLEQRHQKYRDTRDKIAYVYPWIYLSELGYEIANLRAECRYFAVQIIIGFALISDPTDVKWKKILKSALFSDESEYEHELAATWFKRAVKNSKTLLWQIENGKCVGIDFPAHHFSVEYCMDDIDDESEEEKSEPA